MKRATAAWVRKAERDLAGARKLARGKPPLHDVVCFLSQQCAEKYLKGLLQEYGFHPPHRHDLTHLLDLLLPHDATLGRLRRGLDRLTEFAVEYRYPGKQANGRQARTNLRLAERVRLEARRRLGLRV